MPGFFLIVGREIMVTIEIFVCFKNVLNKLKQLFTVYYFYV